MVEKREETLEAKQRGGETFVDLYMRYAGVDSLAAYIKLNSGEAITDVGWTDFLQKEGVLQQS